MMFETEILAVKDKLLVLAREFQQAVSPRVCVNNANLSDAEFMREWQAALNQRTVLLQKELDGVENVKRMQSQGTQAGDIVLASIALAELSVLQVEWAITHIDSIRTTNTMQPIAIETAKSFSRGGDYIRQACTYAQDHIKPS